MSFCASLDRTTSAIEKKKKSADCKDANYLKQQLNPGRSYPNQARLAAHIRNVHKKKFKCKLCGDLFRTDGGLESHIGKSHMSLKKVDRRWSPPGTLHDQTPPAGI